MRAISFALTALFFAVASVATAAGPSASPDTAQQPAADRDWATLGGMQGGDIEALAFIVLMRKNLPPPARPLPSNPCRGWNVGFGKACVTMIKSQLAGNFPDAASEREIAQQAAALQQQLDAMSELGEMEAFRLQMAMDRMSKMMSALSNILKKISDTEPSITQNLK